MSNRPLEIFASQVFAEGATNSVDFTNSDGYLGARFYLDYTAESGTAPTLDLKIQTKDPITGKYFDMAGAAFAQASAVSTDELAIYPGIAETANETVSDVLPLTWRVVATVGGSATPTVTASVGGVYIP